jgi:hypothetical protein
MILNHPGFIAPNTDCIQCGRPGAMQGTTHNGWCWYCVQNRMEGRGIDSYGRPFHAGQGLAGGVESGYIRRDGPVAKIAGCE